MTIKCQCHFKRRWKFYWIPYQLVFP